MVTELRRGKHVARVPGARRAFIMSAAECGSSRLSVEVDSTGYQRTMQRALNHVDKYRDEALMLGYDIDDTRNKSSDTGDRDQLPDRVLKAIKAINGANSCIFAVAATGRTPGDAQIAFGNFLIPLVAKDGS